MPHVAATRWNRQGSNVDRQGEINRGSWLQTRGTSDLEIPAHLYRAVSGWSRNDDRLAILIQQLEPPSVAHIRLIPWHVNLHCDRHGGGGRTGDRPAPTQNVELSIDRLSRICQ